jgi:hypothetical protein
MLTHVLRLVSANFKTTVISAKCHGQHKLMSAAFQAKANIENLRGISLKNEGRKHVA